MITSSPSTNARLPRRSDLSAETAKRFADDPELQSIACLTPITFANSSSNSWANLPDVNQKSSDESTRFVSSDSSNTFPETGICEIPPKNGFLGNASA